jgi:ribosomal protein S12 methylthiotransferase
MGCAKNVVDSEKLMAQLRLSGVEVTANPAEADIAVVNTCGFIAAAKEESIDMIIQNVRRKSRGRLRKVYAMGCLTERYRDDIRKEIPELDGIFGSNELPLVVKELGGRFRRELLGERSLTTPPHTAYLKISEGCDRPCAFCAIPLMRGAHVSRPREEILAEARGLVAGGVREIIVIGQDTTYYGVDTVGSRALAPLLDDLAGIDGVVWLRLMYAFPAQFPLDVLDVMARRPQLCKYIDMPIQHVADPVLKSMRRGITGARLRALIAAIRSAVPGIALRTTLIVGYPGEGEKEFEELRAFVEEARFDRLGVFTYSPEEGTAAFPLGDPVPEEEKERRKASLMEVQQGISEERNAALIGSRQRVLLDACDGDRWVGRTASDAPEIDNEVFVESSRPLEVGSFFDVEIVDAYEYDLVGKAV